MDTFENATLAEPQKELVLAKCWECGITKLCIEYIVCCTGTHFHACLDCKEKILNKTPNSQLQE